MFLQALTDWQVGGHRYGQVAQVRGGPMPERIRIAGCRRRRRTR